MHRIKTTINLFNPELLFVIYFWGFLFLRPILKAFETKSTLILFVFVLVMLFLSLVGMLRRKDARIGNAVILMLIFFIIFLVDSVFRHNILSNEYVYRFVYSGILSVFFLSKVRDADKLLKYFSWFSLLAFLLFGGDPLNGFSTFSDYMDYGFNLVMPAFFGMFLGFHHLKIKWMLIFEILCFLCIVIFANRTSLLSVLVFIILYFILISPNRKRIIFRWIIPMSLLAIIILLNIDSIAKFAYKFVYFKFGYNSYALSKFTSTLHKLDLHVLFSGRLEIWTKATNMFKESPLIGHGLGSFQARYGFYSHNVFLDLLIFFGILGSSIFCFFIITSVIKIWRTNESSKIIGFLFMSLCFPKLIFSAYFLEDVGFWCFIAFTFLSMKSGNSLIDNENRPIEAIR
jgi:O-antigen ligase